MIDRIIEQQYDKDKRDLLAVCDESRSITFGGLAQEVIEKASWIQETLNLEADQPIGLLFGNSVDVVTWLLAIVKSGHAAVLFGTRMKKEEIFRHVQRIRLVNIIADPAFSTGLKAIDSEACSSWKGVIASFVHEEKAVGFKKGDFICHFTSGSDGEPKAAIRTLTNVESEIIETSRRLGWTTHQNFLTIPPICHSFGLIAGTLLPLYYGHTLWLIDQFQPDVVLEYIKKQRISVLFAIPYMYYLLTRRLLGTGSQLPSLRYCFSAGAALDQTVEEDFYQATGLWIIQDYGSTETGVMCINEQRGEYGNSVGWPVTPRQAITIDEEGNLIENPCSQSGELCISHTGAARYLYPEVLNQRNFLGEYYRTGDIARFGTEGEIYLLGRINSLINVAGNKVDPVEVERVIMQHPKVKEAAVSGAEIPHVGNVVRAVIVSYGLVDAAEIQKLCKESLAEFKIPRIIEFVKELPWSHSGKLLRNRIGEV